MATRTVLFLCTGNYYRSRYAEIVFNATVSKMGLAWKATSCGLALERGAGNIGPIAKATAEEVARKGIVDPGATSRMPQPATEVDFSTANWVVALLESEHRPLLQERFPGWEDRAEYWHVLDQPGVLGEIDREVMELVSRLMRGGVKRNLGPLPEPKPEPVAKTPAKKLGTAKVGRETAGRRGKGVTTVFDINLTEDELKELATRLKNSCGTGGTAKDGRIEIQGDHRDKIVAELEKLGYKVKRAGG